MFFSSLSIGDGHLNSTTPIEELVTFCAKRRMASIVLEDEDKLDELVAINTKHPALILGTNLPLFSLDIVPSVFMNHTQIKAAWRFAKQTAFPVSNELFRHTSPTLVRGKYQLWKFMYTYDYNRVLRPRNVKASHEFFHVMKTIRGKVIKTDVHKLGDLNRAVITKLLAKYAVPYSVMRDY